MIVTETLAVRTEVDPEHLGHEGVTDSLFRELSHALISLGEDRAFFIGESSTFMVKGKTRSGTFTVPFVCYWCPDPALGVEFRGGPNDGKIMNLVRGEDGRPPERVSLLLPATEPEIVHDATTLGPLTLTCEYVRAGIDSGLDRWVYQFVQ